MKKLIAVLLVLLVASAFVFGRTCTTCKTEFSGAYCPTCSYDKSYKKGYNEGRRDGVNNTIDATFCAPKNDQTSYDEDACLDGYLDGVKEGKSIYE